jgi:hypothetical protein
MSLEVWHDSLEHHHDGQPSQKHDRDPQHGKFPWDKGERCIIPGRKWNGGANVNESSTCE